jgi:hypothetical protein
VAGQTLGANVRRTDSKSPRVKRPNFVGSVLYEKLKWFSFVCEHEGGNTDEGVSFFLDLVEFADFWAFSILNVLERTPDY